MLYHPKTSNKESTFLVCDFFDLVLIDGLGTVFITGIYRHWVGGATIVFWMAKTCLLALNANYNLLKILVEFLPHLIQNIFTDIKLSFMLSRTLETLIQICNFTMAISKLILLTWKFIHDIRRILYIKEE